MLPLRDHTPSHKPPIVTVLLIAVTILVFFLEFSTENVDAFIARWALIPSQISLGNPFSLLSLVTSQFLHAGIAHIGFNLWYLWIFGDNVEGRFGHLRFLLFYLTAGVAAALVQLLFLLGSDVPMLGASGAIAGVLGAYLALFPHHKIDTFLPGFYARATVPAGMVLLLWFATQLLNGSASVLGTDTAASGGVAWWAHAGGFAFGWIVAQLIRSPRATALP